MCRLATTILLAVTVELAAATGASSGEAAQSVVSKALAVLDAHCARCHQAGRTGARAPERFGNILELAEIARTPDLIVPGRPDASYLYQRMLGRHAPLDVTSSAPREKGPSGLEVEAVRDWIESLPSDSGEAAAPRGPVAAAEPGRATTIKLAIATNKEHYAAGDLVTFSISASIPCHLTLISVDRDGQAVVLFPNDLEPDNLIAAGVGVSVPGASADYQLRFDRAGSETVVGICQRTREHPGGIRADYEKQRFTILGDWRAFLRSSVEPKSENGRRLSRRSRDRSNGETPPVDVSGRDIEGRAALTITVGDPSAGAN